MKKIGCLALLIMVRLFSVNSQYFIVGILDADIFQYMQNTSNIISQLVSLPVINLPSDYTLATNILATYDVIIGRFYFSVATICQQLNLIYFFLNDVIQTFPGVLLEPNNDLVMEAQMLIIYLTKYNQNFPFRLISDGSPDVLTFRMALAENTVSQCNFQPNDTISTISQCYISVFQSYSKSNYIIMSDISNNASLDGYIQQSLYMSLPFSSLLFFPMTDISSILSKYYYSGGYLFELSPEIISTDGILIIRNAINSFNQIVSSLSPYTKLNSTHWTSNNVTSSYNNVIIGNIIKSTNGIYQANGQKVSKTFYIYTNSNAILTTVSSFTYNGNWNEIKGIPNPATTGSRGFINVVYILDSVFITEVNTTSGVIDQGYVMDVFNNILLPIQISFVPIRLTSPAITGTLVNGTFTGMIGQVTSGAAIMTAFPVPIFFEYRNLLTYSDKIIDVQYSMLIKKASPTVNYFKLAQPYSPLVWIALLASIVVLTAVLWLTNLISPNMSNSSDKLTVNNSTFMVIGSILMAKMLVKPNMFSTQIFYIIIWLGTLLLIASYLANLFVAISFADPTTIQFTTFQSLYNQKNYKWVFVNNSYLYNRVMLDIANNNLTIYRSMYEYAQTTWPTQYVIQPDSLEIFAFNNSDTGILNDAIHNMKISLQNCSLLTITDTTFTLSLGYVINPSFPYIKDFTKQIISAREIGILDILATKYFYTGICPTVSSTVNQINPFSYDDMSGIFILIIIGIVLAVIVAALEFMLNKCNLQCQRVVTGNSLVFGRIYKAKVKALDKNGVTVDIGRQSIFSRKDDARIYYVPKKFLGNKRKMGTDIPSPTEQGIMIGTTLNLKYLGNNPEDSKRKFIQIMKK